jgi:hypothetical protein
VDEKGGSTGDVGLEQADAGVGCVPTANDDIVQFIAQELIDDSLVLAVDLDEVGECAKRGDATVLLAALQMAGVGAEDVAHGVGGVAVFADEGFERAAAAVERGGFGAEFVAAAAGGGLLSALRIACLAEVGDLGREALEALCDTFKGELCLSALHAQLFEFGAGGRRFGGEALLLLLQRGERGFGLSDLVVGLRGALHGLQGAVAERLGLGLGGEDVAGGLLRLCLLGVGGVACGGGLCGSCFEEAAMRLQFAGEDFKLGARLREVVVAVGDALGELGDAVRVGGGASSDAFELDGAGVGLGGGVANFAVELVAAGDTGGVLGVHGVEFGGLRVNQRTEAGDLGGGGGLLGVHLGEAAGDDDAQLAAQFFAQSGVTLGFGGLALENPHLARDFLEDVIHSGEILFGRLEAKFCEALFGLEAGDAGGLLDDGAAVERLGGEQLADALLADDGVGLASEAGAHEDVLDVAQAADLAVEQVLGVTGAEEAAGDGDLAGTDRGATELTAADLEDDVIGVRAGCGGVDVCGFFRRAFGLVGCTGLGLGDGLFGLLRSFGAQSRLVPVAGGVDGGDGVRGAGEDFALAFGEGVAVVHVGIDEGERDLSHAQRLAVAGAGEDNVLHLDAAEALGGLLAEHPGDGVSDIGLAAAVGADDNRDARS